MSLDEQSPSKSPSKVPPAAPDAAHTAVTATPLPIPSDPTKTALQVESAHLPLHTNGQATESTQTPSSTYNTDPRGSLKGDPTLADSDHTHTSTQHTASPPPSSGFNPMSASQKTHVNGSQSRKASTVAQKSFMSKVMRILVPCIFPSSSHPVEVADVVIKEPVQEKPETKSPEEEKALLDTATPLPQDPPREEPPNLTIVTEAPRPVTPQTENAETVIPSTPSTHLLPPEETEGMTSGAVQAPGSTGDSPTHEKPHVPVSPIGPIHTDGEDSDHSSDLEEEPEDQEDEEDRLIFNGGAGIPIGPVCCVFLHILQPFIYCAIQDGVPKPLLPPISPQHAGRKCLVLDLDETLVHSSFKV